MYDLYGEGGFDPIAAKNEIACLQLMNIELVKICREKEKEYENIENEVKNIQQ